MKAAIVVLPEESENIIREKISAAQQAGGSPPEIWWFNTNIHIAEQLPVEKVLCFSVPEKTAADCYLPSLRNLVEERKPGLVFFGSGILAKDLCAALACSVGGGCALGVTGITKESEGISIIRFVQGMQLEASFLLTDLPCFFCLINESFKPVSGKGKPELSVIEYSWPEQNWFEDYEETIAGEESGLEGYDVVFAGGRGLGSKGAAMDLMELGRQLGCGVGATRPAALNAWIPLNRMIGISGYTLKPKCCVNFGISGCVPFIRGIEKSGFVISINQDPEAAIFRYSDLGLTADCNEVIRYLLNRIKGEQSV